MFLKRKGNIYVLTVYTIITGVTLALFFSKHAREKMVERGISEKEVLEGIKRGSKHFQKPNKIVSEYRYFSVVYKKINEDFFVITVKPRW